MAIPDFQSIMLPLAQLAVDGNDHTLREATESLSLHFGLTPDERRELLQSGKQARFDNRVAWSLTHLSKAGVLERTGRGMFRLSKRGHDLLATNPSRVTMTLLQQFDEYRLFQKTTSRSNGVTATSPTIEESTQTPDEAIESSYHSLRARTASELLECVRKCSPPFFERLVVDLLVAMGYGGSRKDAGQAIGQSGDGGVDGIIKEDKLGLDAIYLQAKRWDGVVGRPVVQGFAGSLEGLRARKGILIATSRFSQEAREYVTHIEKKIVLIDGEQLTQLMMDHGIGVTEIATYTVKRVDLDYFIEEA